MSDADHVRPGRGNRVVRFFSGAVAEIGDDWVLRAFGAAVAATYVLSAVYWLNVGSAELVAEGVDAVCWPGLEFCRSLRVLGAGEARLFLVGLGVVGALTTVLFLPKRTVKWAYVLLVACVVLKACFMALDYRTRLNQHYMAFFATIAFLFVPSKRDAMRLMVVLFYFWAGTIKLNHEWLSAGAIYGPMWPLSGTLLKVACVHAVVLELVLVWFLLARNKLIFWAVYGQLLVFHILSFQVVGFFYPVLMTLLVSIFPLCFLTDDSREPCLWKRLGRGRVHPAVYGFALAACLLQFTPHVYAGDPSITGQGRLFGLHMFDARVQCEGYAMARSAAGREVLMRPARRLRHSQRMACDPNIFINFARNQCGRTVDGLGEVVDLDLYLESRKVTAGTWTKVIDHKNFCADPIEFAAIGANSWLVEP